MTNQLGRRAFLIGAAAVLKVGAVAVCGARYWGRTAAASPELVGPAADVED
jgi:hypothetical protein